MARKRKTHEAGATDAPVDQGAGPAGDAAGGSEGETASAPAPVPGELPPAEPPVPEPVAPVPTEPEPEPMPAITVIGPKGGFRRAGREFGPEPVTIPLDELTGDQIKALRDEPMLAVTMIHWPRDI